ncbi:GNAT family N-acetyltransferase [Halegenticoccus tardaugens]|uniref:GNAT family N-acetyltransferase n=1 Tax=Halegenticoccus tardaugens TaxID=2071624 RepID=UPI0013E92EC7|nr:GNAT family N-acetyltransferase [Halegenticoccus tardaugens]
MSKTSTPDGVAESTSEEYRIREFRRGDEAGFLSLFGAVFGDASANWFEWKYVDNPYVDHVPICVAAAGDEIVGANPFFALELAYRGKRLLALQPVDAMVHPDHRQNGLLTRMTEHAIERYAAGDPALFFNFPNEHAKRAFAKLGWETVGELAAYYRVQNPAGLLDAGREDAVGRVARELGTIAARGYLGARDRLSAAPSGGLTVNRHPRIPVSEFAELSRANAPGGLHAVRDETYYRWRFGNPEWEYDAYTARRGGSPIAGIVAGTRRDDGATVTKLTDVAPLPKRRAHAEAFSHLLSRIVEDHADADLIAAADGTLPHDLLRRHGFHPNDAFPLSRVAGRTTLVARSLSDDLTFDPAERFNWQLSFGEQDTC